MQKQIMLYLNAHLFGSMKKLNKYQDLFVKHI